MTKRVNKENTEQTPKGGKGKIHEHPNANTNGFDKNGQPSPEAKSNGHKKKRALKDLAEALVTGEGLEKAKATAKKVGLNFDDNDVNLEIAMTLRQIEKALAKGDTSAYNAAMDRLRGKAKQQVDVTSGGEKIEQWITIAGQEVKIA